MSHTKLLLDSLLREIYGRQQRRRMYRHKRSKEMASRALLPESYNLETLEQLGIMKLIDISAILKLEIRLMSHFLERVLINRDRIRRHQNVLCGFVDAILHVVCVCILHGCYDAHARMRFSLSPPPQKAISSTESARARPAPPPSAKAQKTRTSPSTLTSPTYRYTGNNNVMQSTSPVKAATSTQSEQDAAEAASDYNQWLHAMKLVARLPGGMPPEFRRKLWLSLADKYLKSKNVDWSKEEEKCFCEKWREDDEELGIQIVKDLHRTGSNLCTGPAGNINQAKLKRILLGYARFNPEVGYCQGFNMLGALILQVMDKEESESIKVMIYLVEGVLPSGYFCGSMGGLQADMGVFRELMQTKLPRLAKHLQKLQGPIENAYEPPLTNVFTMQWFLTLFCTCLPMTCVLRVWDLVLIEGSDVLLRTALVLWSLLEERVLNARTADDFYGKMGSFSSELLNGHLIDSNGLIEKVVQLGPIPEIQKLRDKHLYNIAPLRHKQSIQLYFDDEEAESDEDSRLAVASVWGIPWGRRGSHSQTITKQLSTTTTDNRDRLALDISLLKKQYDRLRERQKQAHIILTTACSTNSRPNSSSTTLSSGVPVNQLLMGRPAIVTNRGRRPPLGAIPPARKPSLPTILQSKAPEKQLRRGETINWRDMDPGKRRRDSLTWKEIKADRALMSQDGSDSSAQSNKLRSRIGKSDSSSYSEESDEDDGEGSSTDTSLCDEDDPVSTGDKTLSSSVENSPKRRTKSSRRQKELSSKLQELKHSTREQRIYERPKSWAPSSNEIPFMLMTSDSPVHSGDEKTVVNNRQPHDKCIKEEDDCLPECDRMGYTRVKELEWSDRNYSPIAGDLATSALGPLHVQTDILELPVITSTSQLSPMPDISGYLNNSSISPLPTPKPLFIDSTNSLGSGDGDNGKKFDVNDDGVTNQYFERVNSVERPTNLELFYSLNEEDNIRLAYDGENGEKQEPEIEENQNIGDRHLDRASKVVLIGEESKKPPEVFEDCIQKSPEHSHQSKFLDSQFAYEDSEVFDPRTHTRDDNIPGENRDDFAEMCAKANEESTPKPMGLSKKQAVLNANKKRRDPRRLTRSSTIEIEERFQALEKHLSLEEPFKTIPKESVKCIQSATHKDNIKRIPSTADLEERYNTLEKQLSLNKDTNEKECAKICESEPITDVDILRRPEKKRIPTAADLEHRYDALARQMSSSGESAKEPVDLKGEDTEKKSEKNRDDESSKDTKKEELNSNDTKKATQKSEVSENDKKPESENDKSSPKQRLKKLPSTAELEDRFNALERKISIQNSSPSKSKKEPPDDVANEEKSKSTQSDENKERPQAESKEKLIPEKNATDDFKKNETKPAEENKKAETKKSLDENINDDKDDKKSDSPKAEVEKSKKKLPPSTEELEKRFQALEKQLSSPNLEGIKKRQSTEQENKEEDQDAIVVKDNKKIEKKIAEDTQKTQNSSPPAESKKDSPTKSKEKSRNPEKAPEKKNVSNESESVNVKDDQTKKSIKSFEDKCKTVNKELSGKSSTTTSNCDTENKTSKNNSNASKETKIPETKETFTEKMKSINKQLEEKNLDESENGKEVVVTIEPTDDHTELGKRRASEPPSTEDLERRYETLKRRMSTKALSDKNSEKPETVEEAMERIEKKVIEEHVETTDADEEQPKRERKSSEPPSTENLEKRFEALQRQSSTMSDEMVKSGRKAENRDTALEYSANKETKKSSVKTKATTTKELPVHKEKVEISKSVQTTPPNERKSNIPVAPPMPELSLHADPSSLSQRRALIEELQKKMKTQPNDENLRPSDINPNRKSPRLSPRADATPEAHADSAFYRSGNYEPWQTVQSPHRMVRRFSDLPSRADLENRVQFLEKQLIKKFYKQRCASDSEVTSRMYFADAKSRRTRTDEKPSTSKASIIKVSPESDLEKRVLLLEKQLSENSLKLLEAMRSRTFESPQKSYSDSESPRKLSTETVDATGKELVRYTHFGEVEETDSHKPINISINIKMLLNKDGEEKRTSDHLPTTEELEKRLEMLEQQLKIVKPRLSSTAEKEEVKEVEVEVEARENEDDVFLEDCGSIEQENDNKEIIKAQGNIKDVEVSPVKVEQKEVKEVTKEETTLENQETAKSNKTRSGEESKTSVEKEKPEGGECEKKAESKVEEKSKDLKELNKQHVESMCSTSKEHDKTSIDTSSESPMKPEQPAQVETPKDITDNVVVNEADVGHVDPNNKTLVLLLDNEPKAVKVRRLTRANTEELEGLFQALEKQISDRNLIKTDDGKLKRADTKEKEDAAQPSQESKEFSELTKEIEKLSTDDVKKDAKPKQQKVEEEFDWGSDPVKRHLKRKTVHLPSTKELEARFRSLERQIKLLEDVENIDVEQRLNEIERKIKLQYSLSHEKDLSKFLELCEGKGLDDPIETPAPAVHTSNTTHKCECECPKSPHNKPKSPYTSPSRSRSRTPYTSPTRSKSPARSKSPGSSHSPDRSHYVNRCESYDDEGIPRTEELEHRFRALDLPRSKSKENLKKKAYAKKQPIHPLEMLLDPSPDENEIPTTGELEHRMKMLDEKRITPSPPHESRPRSRSPTIDDIKRKKLLEEQRPKPSIHRLETMVTSPTKRELPTEEELEARVKALEKDHKFDFKMQKNYMEFNQKLKDVISPSLSFEEFKTTKSREESPHRNTDIRSTTPKSALRDTDTHAKRDDSTHYRSTSPKVIRFSDDEDYRPKSRTELRDTGRMVGNPCAALELIQENSKLLHRILEKTLADSTSSIYGSSAALAEGLDEMGSRLMRETSPLQRTGTHTGVPLRTNDNINERLSSIKETIKSIDSLCEEKPYRKEKCQRYIDSLFSDSIHFASKKSSLEDLHSRSSRSPSRYGHREYTPSIRISDHSLRPSEHYLSRSIGSAESLRSTSPLRAASPKHYRSTRDLRREVSPRRRIDEEREEYESRVRRAHMLPNSILNDYSDLSSGSLIKFHKVDRQQLDTYERERSSSRSASRSPLKSTYGSRETMMMSHNNNNNNYNTTTFTTANTNDSYTKKTDTLHTTTRPAQHNRLDLDRPVSPYRQTSHNLLGYDTSPLKRSSTPVYNPPKLEIRHTTVTSTFYDRLLTEKQIEKNLSQPPSRSPVISPSGMTKNYLDLTATNPNAKSQDASPTSSYSQATAQLNSFMGINASLGIGAASGSTAATAYTATSTQKTVSASQNNSYSIHGTGNLSSIQNTPLTRLPLHVAAASDDPAQNDLRIRSCDNILMQLKSTSTSTTAITAAGAANDTVQPTHSMLYQLPPTMGTSLSSGTPMSYNFPTALPIGHNNSRSAPTRLTFSSIAPIITSTTTFTSTTAIATTSTPSNTSPLITTALSSNPSTFNYNPAPQQPHTEFRATPFNSLYSSTLGNNTSDMPK